MALAEDIFYMKSALNMARRGLGRVAPNPAVGCVIVKDGIVLARARTADGGRPHAETQALQQAGKGAKGSTVYVSLEPCAHHGQTGPCTEALINAGISRVVVACHDHDPRTSGQGIEQLREAGIEVDIGVLEDEARALNLGFFLSIVKKRPFVTLKVATSADEKVTGGAQRWITGPEARARSHLLRSSHDAIMAGIGTVLADDPLLTTRVPGLEHHIIRVVLDNHSRVPHDSQLIRTASKLDPVIVLHSCQEGEAGDFPEREGVMLLRAENLKEGLEKLAGMGVTRLMVEGGPKVHAAFIAAGLYDALAWFKAPHEIGEAGTPALKTGSFSDICDDMVLSEKIACGPDTLEVYTKPEAATHAFFPTIPVKPVV